MPKVLKTRVRLPDDSYVGPGPVDDDIAEVISNPAAWETSETAVSVDDSGGGDDSVNVNAMTKAELVEHAASNQIDIDPNANKPIILAAIIAATED